MKTKKPIMLLIMALSLFTPELLSSNADESVLVGLSSLDVTPPVGVPLAGYGGGARRNLPYDIGDKYPFAHFFNPSKGKRDPIRSKVMAIKKGKKRLYFMSVDVVGITADVKADLIKRVQHLNIQEDELFISATHTHSGPGTLSRNTLWQFLAMDRFESMIYKSLLSDLSMALIQAHSNAKPAELYTAVFETDGLQKNRRDPARGTDTQANMLMAKDMSGQWMGGIVNYAIHGTCFGMSNFDYSADVPGEIEMKMREKITELNGGNGRPIVLFINGAEGDVSPYKGGEGRMKDIAKRFAAHSAEGFQQMQKVTPEWKTQSLLVRLPQPRLNLKGCLVDGKEESERIAKMSIPLPKVLAKKTTITSVKLGNIQMMTWPGEPNTSLGRMLKNEAYESGAQYAWVLGLTNDHLSYFTSEQEYHEGGYEACASFYGAKTGENIVQAHRSLLGLSDKPAEQ